MRVFNILIKEDNFQDIDQGRSFFDEDEDLSHSYAQGAAGQPERDKSQR